MLTAHEGNGGKLLSEVKFDLGLQIHRGPYQGDKNFPPFPDLKEQQIFVLYTPFIEVSLYGTMKSGK